MSKLLEVKNLKTSFKTHIGDVQAVRGVSFYLNKGEALGIVGESGCGKSVTMMSIMRLLADNAVIEADEIIFNGEHITNPTEDDMQKIRGNEMAMIFQDPMTSLNPLFRYKETPLTACTSPICVLKEVFKFFTSNNLLIRHSSYFLFLGSKASVKPSPNKLNAKIIKQIAPAGNNNWYAAVLSNPLASFAKVPKDASGALIPNPMKLKNASVNIA